MLMTAAEKTKLGGVTSFDKWPGYEQQYGSKRPKQVRNNGIKKKMILLSERGKQISGTNHTRSIHWRREENL